MYKKLFIFTFLFVAIIGLTACGKNDRKQMDDESNVMTEQQMSEQQKEMIQLEDDFEAFKKQKKQEAGVE